MVRDNGIKIGQKGDTDLVSPDYWLMLASLWFIGYHSALGTTFNSVSQL